MAYLPNATMGSTPLISTIEKSTQVSDYLGFSLFYAMFLSWYILTSGTDVSYLTRFSCVLRPKGTTKGTTKLRQISLHVFVYGLLRGIAFLIESMLIYSLHRIGSFPSSHLLHDP